MKMVAEYLEHALDFERMAADEQNPELKDDFERQAANYRKLVDGLPIQQSNLRRRLQHCRRMVSRRFGGRGA